MRRALDERWVDAAILALCLACFWSVFWPLARAGAVSIDDLDAGRIAAAGVSWLRAAAAGVRPGLPLPAPPLIYGWGHGPFNGYCLIPFLIFFGRTFDAIHIAGGFFASLTILGTYLLGRELVGRRTGLLAAALLSASPGMVNNSLSATPAALPSISFGLAGLAALAAGARGGPPWLLAAAGAAFGVAVGSNWMMLAWAIAAGALAWRWRGGLMRGLSARGRVRWLALCVILAAAHLAPVAMGWRSYPCWPYLTEALRGGHGASSLSPLAGERLAQLWRLPGAQAAPFWAAWTALAAIAAWRRPSCAAGVRDLGLFATVYLVLSLGSPTGPNWEHVAPLLPILALLAASSASLFQSRARALTTIALASTTTITGLWMRCAPQDPPRPNRATEESELGLCRWRSAHQRETLVVNPSSEAEYLLDFCFPGAGFYPLAPRGELPENPLSRGRLLLKRSAGLLRLRNAVFVFAAGDARAQAAAERQARALGLELAAVERFRGRDGRIALSLLRARPRRT